MTYQFCSYSSHFLNDLINFSFFLGTAVSRSYTVISFYCKVIGVKMHILTKLRQRRNHELQASEAIKCEIWSNYSMQIWEQRGVFFQIEKNESFDARKNYSTPGNNHFLMHKWICNHEFCKMVLSLNNEFLFSA